MALTSSTMLELGTQAIDFELLDTVSKKKIKLSNSVVGKQGVLVMFISNHCPYVKYVQPELVKIGVDYLSKNIAIIAISSNDIVKYPDDSPEYMREEAIKWNYKFPYLYDEFQTTAKSYKAVCTPEFYLFNEKLLLVYRGQLDGARPGNNIPLTGSSLRDALDNLIARKPIDKDQKPSLGCSIKWK